MIPSAAYDELVAQQLEELHVRRLQLGDDRVDRLGVLIDRRAHLDDERGAFDTRLYDLKPGERRK